MYASLLEFVDGSATTLEGSPSDILQRIELMETRLFPVTAIRIRLSSSWMEGLTAAEYQTISSGLANRGYIAPMGVPDSHGDITYVRTSGALLGQGGTIFSAMGAYEATGGGAMKSTSGEKSTSADKGEGSGGTPVPDPERQLGGSGQEADEAPAGEDKGGEKLTIRVDDKDEASARLLWDQKATLHRKKKFLPLVKPIETWVMAAMQLSAKLHCDRQELAISIEMIACQIGEYDDDNLPVIAAMDVLITSDQATSKLLVPELTSPTVILSSTVISEKYQKTPKTEATAKAGVNLGEGLELGGELSWGEEVGLKVEHGARLPLQVLSEGFAVGLRSPEEAYGACISFQTSTDAALLTEPFQRLRCIQFPREGPVRKVTARCQSVKAGNYTFTAQVRLQVHCCRAKTKSRADQKPSGYLEQAEDFIDLTPKPFDITIPGLCSQAL